MAHTDVVLEIRIVELFKDADFPYDRIDIGITIMKMSDIQKQDLSAMIDFFTKQGEEASYIAGNVGHDLGGLKDEFISGLKGFSLRSSGFAKKTA